LWTFTGSGIRQYSFDVAITTYTNTKTLMQLHHHVLQRQYNLLVRGASRIFFDLLSCFRTVGDFLVRWLTRVPNSRPTRQTVAEVKEDLINMLQSALARLEEEVPRILGLLSVHLVVQL
jgi:hypothetical protein